MFTRVQKTIFRFLRYDEGRTLIEYAMFTMLLALAFLTALTYLGHSASQF